MLIISHSDAMRKLMEIFQMPKHTKSFTIEGDIDGVVEITLTYYPEDTSFVADEAASDDYGNPKDGSRIINCCFPDCGCDGSRLCQAENGPSIASCSVNIERGSR